MAQRLFNIGKIPVFVEHVTLGIEKRKGDEVTVVVLGLKVQPFDGKLASAFDSGVGDGNIKATAFNLSTGEPKEHFTRHDFKLGIARQLLECWATPDSSKASIALDGVRIYGTYVRSQKDMPTALALICKASFGPVGRDELDYLKGMFRGQVFITFREADATMQFGDGEAEKEPEGGEDGGGEPQLALPAHEFDTDAKGKPISDTKDPVRQRLTSHANKKRPALPATKKAKAAAKRRR